MSIYTGLEATIMLLRKRIELDLNPRIKRQNQQIDSLTDDLESFKAECSKLDNDCRSYNEDLGNLKRRLQAEENYVSLLVGEKAELGKIVEWQANALTDLHHKIDTITEVLGYE